MTKLLRLLFKFQTEYSGDPRFISGNALRHALSEQINSSIGIFTEIDRLTPSSSYQDFFSIRTCKCFAFPHFEKFFDWNTQRESFHFFFTPKLVTFDILDAPDYSIDKVNDAQLLQLGGQRHCGYGAVRLHDFLEIEVADLSLPTQATHLTLISPMIHFPPFIETFDCRNEAYHLWSHGRKNSVQVISPGQFFRLKSNVDVPKIAENGILRKIKANKALFSQFGFGEFVLHNWVGRGA
jgi:hypothetical protein